MRTLRITAGNITLRATLRDTPTADAIWKALPIQGTIHTWGDEIYFEVPIEAVLESDAKDVVESGELAYWPTGKAIAIGFGPTPLSRGEEIRLAALTNIWANTLDDVRQLKTVQAGDTVLVETD